MHDALSNYRTEAEMLTSELYCLLRDADLVSRARLLSGQAIKSMTEAEREAAFGLIAKSPAQRKTVEKHLAGQDAAKRDAAIRLVARAIYLNTCGVAAMDLASQLSDRVPGRSYRAGARYAAEVAAASSGRLSLSQDAIISGSFI